MLQSSWKLGLRASWLVVLFSLVTCSTFMMVSCGRVPSPHTATGVTPSSPVPGLSSSPTPFQIISTPSPSSGPSITPMPHCSTPTYFEEVWVGHAQLGCPTISSTSDFTFQKFEKGLMIWRKSPIPSTIYALYFDSRRWEKQPDPGGFPVPSCAAAERTGGLGPIFGFGRLWCEPWSWKTLLGQPLEREQDGGNNQVQDFENGTAMTVGKAGRFILYSVSTWETY